MREKVDFATRLIHHRGGTCSLTGAVNPPIYQVSTFRQSREDQEYDYSRTGNPTRTVLENYIADLEGGSEGVAFASGMSAISASIMLLRNGDHLIATEGLYGGSYRILTKVFQDYGIESTFVDTTNLANLSAAFRPHTRAVLLETPSNPLMGISSIREISSLAEERGALLIVDNTFMSPLLQRPLELGAHVVLHSATKFLGGHSDLLLGLVATSRGDIATRLRHLQNAMGAVPSPFDCWLLMRGIKTLAVRLAESQRSAQIICDWLLKREEIQAVLYPGLEHSPGFQTHSLQADGPGAIISFRLSSSVKVDKFLQKLNIWTVAVSLGAVESIITQPARMTHLTYARDERVRLGIDDNLIRLSVGIESVDDLIRDLEKALDEAH
jgi:cystathionine beta-lyase/cystathionine gamma-synthase